ncbi:glycosyltransferase family 2 protein [Bacteroides stercorirosoris]|uniref:glycosyltransferase family 2 protein n=1 Tax=Bacteroides stercorirosoris TaxID=871324 RepID=UPI00046F1001|nr:glycosyltransferase [Bacteroides stercorirosoris]
MTIPVILLNYNSSTDCHKCISFLKKQEGIQIEIVVVDNCSVEADLQNLRTLCSEQGCTLLENKENRATMPVTI